MFAADVFLNYRNYLVQVDLFDVFCCSFFLEINLA